MKTDVNLSHSSTKLSTYYHINNARSLSLSDKLDRTLSTHSDIIDALMNHGCDNCIAIVKDVVSKYNNRTSEGNGSSEVQTSKGEVPNDIFNIRK